MGCACATAPKTREILSLQPAEGGGYIVWAGGTYNASHDTYPRSLAFAGLLDACLDFIAERMEPSPTMH